MDISDIRIRRVYNKGKLKAVVSLTVGGDFAVHDIKVIQGENRIFAAMPSRIDEKGMFRDIVHPITDEARRKLEEKIIIAYNNFLEENREDGLNI